ncbi:hypothetical protein EJ08DRAFT_457726 [Tothia fuscella]|uniref:BSD domain-containing protein n=1 Tax=Tothia fuscella TaxID=1048955 RepID=A0A9P4NIK7_9PEZI|nr:hypothetical protein EJ08DRAFT_457726 [Tothia fuscella]
MRTTMSPSVLKASATYKKQNGTLSLSEDRRSIFWTPSLPPSAAPSLKISATDILNLQQSPASSPKASLKVIVQPSGASTPENHVFTLTSPTTARAELTAILDPLKEVISALKTVPVSGAGSLTSKDGGSSAAMAIAQAVSSGASQNDEDIYTDARLLSNLSLQKSLLGASPLLRQRFDESLQNKPEVISVAQFSTQFWSTRVHLLRAHAVEKSQHQGSYNVLSMVKPIHDNDKLRLELNKEQIQLIFSQHPLMRRVYDDLVPKSFSENDFWAKFVVSRLFKQLKGEKITEHDPPIPKFDNYLNYDEKAFRTQQFIMQHVPRFMDIEGNEQNHSKRLGNAPDTTMKPSSHDRVPILRALNNMSEQMMGNVAPSDAEAHAPVGLDEETFNELQLRDLQRLDADNRVRLRISNEQHQSAKDRDHQGLRPSYRIVLQDFRASFGIEVDLPTELDSPNQLLAGEATGNIMDSVKQCVLLLSNMEPDSGLSPALAGQAVMTHNTTVEFLHYFWSVYLSGDESRANELAKLAETLGNSLVRIDQVATQAEKERSEALAEQQRQLDAFNQRTGQKRKRDTSKAGGGRKAVEAMLMATTRAVRFANDQYEQEYKAQSAQ